MQGGSEFNFSKLVVCILTCPTILSNYGTTRKNTQPYYTTKISNKIYVFATRIHHKIKIANKRVSIANDETCSGFELFVLQFEGVFSDKYKVGNLLYQSSANWRRTGDGNYSWSLYLRFPWFSLPSVLMRYFPKNSKIILLHFNVTNCQLTDGENYSAVSNFEQ